MFAGRDQPHNLALPQPESLPPFVHCALVSAGSSLISFDLAQAVFVSFYTAPSQKPPFVAALSNNIFNRSRNNARSKSYAELIKRARAAAARRAQWIMYRRRSSGTTAGRRQHVAAQRQRGRRAGGRVERERKEVFICTGWKNDSAAGAAWHARRTAALGRHSVILY